MKFFLDTANLDQIREAYAMGVLDGVTTNPSLMAKEGIKGKENQYKHYIDICNIVDGDDRFVTGYSTRPEYFFGINIGASWKNLSLTMQWTGAAHVDKMLDLEYRIPFTNSGNRGLLSYFYDGCWTPDNQQGAIYPRPAETSESWNSEASTLWLQDASYLRLKNLSLTYTFSGYDVFKKLGINSLGLTFSGYNLLTFTGLKYIDPEGITDNNGSYPLVRLYSFGLNINF